VAGLARASSHFQRIHADLKWIEVDGLVRHPISRNKMLRAKDCRLTAHMSAKLAEQAGYKMERSILFRISNQFSRLANRKFKLDSFNQPNQRVKDAARRHRVD
jgi:hypothetical protein